ncbi:MAG: tRNA (guanosine(46)-N7)-methyltransferase TrmB [candidate division Zixibacteria bacterium]|nr:tRNA (guanosine(46)-N7)-methyltransferase TrmB [candidate division Zixibacteria bacterium]
MKTFPFQYEAGKPILIYPEGSETKGGDVLEIGPGRGDLLLDLAEAMPAARLVAIEIGKRRYYRLIPRIEKRGLSNIQLIGGDARIVLTNHFSQGAFDKIYVLFPDPWPKKRHAYRRLLNTEFIELLTRFLTVDGDLFMATDVDWYAEWAANNAESLPQLENMGNPYVDASELFSYTPTYFEQKWRADGRSIYYMRFRRLEHAGPSSTDPR